MQYSEQLRDAQYRDNFPWLNCFVGEKKGDKNGKRGHTIFDPQQPSVAQLSPLPAYATIVMQNPDATPDATSIRNPI
jgi:hypothetical protein